MSMNTKDGTVSRWFCCAGLLLTLGPITAAQEIERSVGDGDHGEQQRLLERLNVLEAWEITKGDSKVIIGVIDNGFDFFHPDLKGQIRPGYYYSGGFQTEFFEGIAHGTQVASLIVAKDDHVGMVGLAPNCNVLTASQGMIEHTLIKLQRDYFRAHPKAQLRDWQEELTKHRDILAKFGQDWIKYQLVGAADAIHYLVDHGVRVINISGGMERSLVQSKQVWNKLEKAFAYAAARNVIIVLAAGNNAQRWEGYPGDAESTLVVGASLLDDSRWEEQRDFRGTTIKHGSNFGKRLSVMAPVDHLKVCLPHERRMYELKDGPMGATRNSFEGAHKVVSNGATSSAAPIVSSLVALVISARPELSANEIIKIVKQGCDDIGEEGYDIKTGFGRVNFGKTLKLAENMVITR